MIPLYKAIAMSISIVAAIAITFGMWIGTLLLADYITDAIAHIIGIKPIIEISKVEVLSESAKIKL